MDKKTLFTVGGTVLIGLVVTLLWQTFAKGVEATAAENPAFAEIHTELKAIRGEIKAISTQVTAMDLKFSITDAELLARQNLIVEQSNAILAAHQ